MVYTYYFIRLHYNIYYIILYYIILYCIALHCIVLYCIVLYYIVLYCIQKIKRTKLLYRVVISNNKWGTLLALQVMYPGLGCLYA